MSKTTQNYKIYRNTHDDCKTRPALKFMINFELNYQIPGSDFEPHNTLQRPRRGKSKSSPKILNIETYVREWQFAR